jgi:dTMP kinase
MKLPEINKRWRLDKNEVLNGKLYVVEGCDGSGKSTQIYLLKRWLESKGFIVFFTEWNSSDLIRESTSQAKRKDLLTPTTFSLMHASDFADRYEKMILPQLRAGYIVLCDRYIYTAFARDMARGCNREWVKNVYSFVIKPDIIFYFQAPLQISLNRILTGRLQLEYHESGMDMKFSNDRVESFKIFQGIIKKHYDDMAEEEGFTIIDASQSIEAQQTIVRSIVNKNLEGYSSPCKHWQEGSV